jgi:beta-alanine--pyruvate transaminase
LNKKPTYKKPTYKKPPYKKPTLLKYYILLELLTIHLFFSMKLSFKLPKESLSTLRDMTRIHFSVISKPITTVSTSGNHYWMPFTANSRFKTNHTKDMIIDRADGNYYYTKDGKKILDGISGLWCSNAGHCHPLITKAMRDQIGKLDYAPSFQVSHELPFKYAERLVKEIAPIGLDKVFFSVCGSTAVDCAMKIVLAYHKSKGQPDRSIFLGREQAYHGVGFGGTSIGGMPANKLPFKSGLLPNVDHILSTHNLEQNAFSRGQPEWGAHLADNLELMIEKNGGASKIAALFLEPVSGSPGVLVPPKGYLERIREICTKHEIILVFDEVITAFGRLGAPTAATYFNLTPDMMICAKGMTNAAAPGGAVLLNNKFYDSIVSSAPNQDSIELFHGHTYTGHPMTMTAGMATLDAYKSGDMFNNAKRMSKIFEDGLHSMREHHSEIIDIRNIGLMGAIEFKPLKSGIVGRRAHDIFVDCFKEGLFVRSASDTIVFSPPLCADEDYYHELFTKLQKVLRNSQENTLK